MEAWSHANGKGALIAVVDTGVDLRHPDLKRKIAQAPDADFVDPDGGDGPQDEHGHGTRVAGIAAASTGNGKGIAGVAPRARILPVTVLNANAAGSAEWIAEGIRYAAKRGADVMRNSRPLRA